MLVKMLAMQIMMAMMVASQFLSICALLERNSNKMLTLINTFIFIKISSIANYVTAHSHSATWWCY